MKCRSILWIRMPHKSPMLVVLHTLLGLKEPFPSKLDTSVSLRLCNGYIVSIRTYISESDLVLGQYFPFNVILSPSNGFATRKQI